MRKPYFLERHRIKKSQSDRRDEVEKALHEKGQSIIYWEEDEDESGNTQDTPRA
jgi:hypothetical protein